MLDGIIMKEPCLRLSLCFIAVIWFLSVLPLVALDHVQTNTSDTPEQFVGRILAEDTNGDFFLQTRDGKIFEFAKKDVTRCSDKEPFVPLKQKEIVPLLKQEFGEGFSAEIVGKYVIIYNTSPNYAKWVAGIFNKLYSKYRTVWKDFGFILDEPEFPLVIVLFSSKAKFNAYGKKELGNDFSEKMNAYYHLRTNRVVLCDLTGIEEARENYTKKNNQSRINEILARPGAGYNISAIIHESAHQIGFNCGMFERLAPVPLWLLEGVAMLHEIPDVNNPRRGEPAEPRINQQRIRQLASYLKKQPSDPIRSMVKNDANFRNLSIALDNYGLAWGVTYYLYKNNPKEFAGYLECMSKKTLADDDSPEIRLKEFERFFGDDWTKFHNNFGRFFENRSKP
ncbi:MAG: DUF1570 domain-containing protein [Thermoguttaceae bacterium]